MADMINTIELRAIARKLNSLAQTVADCPNGLHRMQTQASGALKGQTADRVVETLDSLRADIMSISTGLSAAGAMLTFYVQRLEEADRESARVIGQR